MHLLTTLLLSTTTLLLHPISSLFLSKPPTANILTPSTLTNHTLPTTPPPRCVRITDPPMLGLNPTNCEIALQIACNKLTTPPPSRLVRDKWIWTELPGCALGYWLPDEILVPFLGQCLGALEGIVEVCGRDSRWNAGGENVEEMPDFGGDGRAVVEGEMRYVMAPERLTLG